MLGKEIWIDETDLKSLKEVQDMLNRIVDSGCCCYSEKSSRNCLRTHSVDDELKEQRVLDPESLKDPSSEEVLRMTS